MVRWLAGQAQMNFPVPWRCLLPSEAVDFVTYNNSAILRDLSDRTGAMIDISGDRDTPQRLSDRICTISGQAEQKEGACRGIVEKLRKMQELQDPFDIGFFVIILPAAAVPVVVGAQGATIKEVVEATKIELSIGKENVMGMPDTPIGLEGTAEQVVGAVAGIHRVVQDMADKGRLQPSDFKYRPEKAAAAIAAGAGLNLPEVLLPPSQHNPLGGLDPTQNFRTKAKLLIDTQTAGWLIGKQGRTIREMQINSGAFLHMLREEDSPPAATPTERCIEICGRYERKLEGLQVVLRTADAMPGTQAPNYTLMLAPTVLLEDATMGQVASLSGCTVAARAGGAAGEDEAVAVITGSITGRIQAAQAFMTLIDKAHMSGLVVARSIDGEVVGKDGRPRQELRDAWAASPEASSATSTPWAAAPSTPLPARAEMPTLTEQSRPVSASQRCDQGARESQPFDLPSRAPCQREFSLPPRDDPRSRPEPQTLKAEERQLLVATSPAPGAPLQACSDPWASYRGPQASGDQAGNREPVRSALPASSLAVQHHLEEPHHREELHHREGQPPLPSPQQQQHQQHQEQGQQQIRSFVVSQPSERPTASESHQVQQRLAHASSEDKLVRISEPLDLQHPSANGQWNVTTHAGTAVGDAPPTTVCREPQRPNAVNGPLYPRSTSGSGVVDNGSEGMRGPSSQADDDLDGGPTMLTEEEQHKLHPADAASALALGQVRIEQLLAPSSVIGNWPSQVLLLVPDELLQRALIPKGVLAEVAARCGVRIDLGPLAQPCHRQVLVTGTVVGNAAAVYWLQDGMARQEGTCH